MTDIIHTAAMFSGSIKNYHLAGISTNIMGTAMLSRRRGSENCGGRYWRVQPSFFIRFSTAIRCDFRGF